MRSKAIKYLAAFAFPSEHRTKNQPVYIAVAEPQTKNNQNNKHEKLAEE